MNNQESYSYQPRSTSSIVIDSTISSRNIFFLNNYRNKDIQMYALTPHTYFNTQYIYFFGGTKWQAYALGRYIFTNTFEPKFETINMRLHPVYLTLGLAYQIKL